MKFNHNVYREEFSQADTEKLVNILDGKPENGANGGGGGNASPDAAAQAAAAGGAAAGGAAAGGGANGAGAEGAGAAGKGAEGAAAGAGAQAAANGAAAAGGAQAGAAAGGGKGAEEEIEQISLEELGFSSIEDIRQMRINYERSQKELTEIKAVPKFASEKARILHEFANRHEGMELQAAQTFLELVNLDLTKEADHQLRFRAFQLKPEMKGYSQGEIQALFADEELRNFGDPNVENGQSEIQKIRAKGATAQAKDQLEKIQVEYRKAAAQEAQKSPEDIAKERAEYTDHVKKGLVGFDGIALKLSATLEDGKKHEGSLNFKLDAEKQMPAVVNAVVDPAGWWAETLKKHGVLVDGQEQPNVSKLAEIVSFLDFKEELLNQAYQQGRHDQIALHASTHRNANAGGGEGGGAAAEGTKKSESEEMVAGAIKTIGLSTGT